MDEQDITKPDYTIPIEGGCPECDGTGFKYAYDCPRCGGSGRGFQYSSGHRMRPDKFSSLRASFMALEEHSLGERMRTREQAWDDTMFALKDDLSHLGESLDIEPEIFGSGELLPPPFPSSELFDNLNLPPILDVVKEFIKKRFK